eukprot:763239-Hanusia_phi.AAC.1
MTCHQVESWWIVRGRNGPGGGAEEEGEGEERRGRGEEREKKGTMEKNTFSEGKKKMLFVVSPESPDSLHLATSMQKAR